MGRIRELLFASSAHSVAGLGSTAYAMRQATTVDIDHTSPFVAPRRLHVHVQLASPSSTWELLEADMAGAVVLPDWWLATLRVHIFALQAEFRAALIAGHAYVDTVE